MTESDDIHPDPEIRRRERMVSGASFSVRLTVTDTTTAPQRLLRQG